MVFSEYVLVEHCLFISLYLDLVTKTFPSYSGSGAYLTVYNPELLIFKARSSELLTVYPLVSKAFSNHAKFLALSEYFSRKSGYFFSFANTFSDADFHSRTKGFSPADNHASSAITLTSCNAETHKLLRSVINFSGL